MSAQSEARVRRALESLSLAPSASAATTAAAVASELSETKLRRLYDDLLAQGFAAADVEASLTAVVRAPWSSRGVPADEAVSITAALDWLCFELPTERLPRRYQGGVRAAAAAPGSAAAAVEVVHAPADAAWDDSDDDEGDRDAAAAEAKAADAARAAAEAKSAAARRAAEEEARAKAEAEAAARANREWIVRQYEDDDDSEEDSSDHDSLEDFGLDPEEIERRARVRRRRRAFETDPEKHVATMRAERDEARADAAAGKATRDKARQRAAGDALRRLGDELASYGLSMDDLDAPEEPEPPREHQQTQQQDVEAASVAEDVVASNRDRDSNPNPDPDPDPAPAGDGSSSDSDDGGFGLDLFDGDEETAAVLGADEDSRRRPFVLSEAPLFPPSTIAAATTATGKKGKKGQSNAASTKPSSKVDPVQPKALLQMLCRREGWIAPRYDKATVASGAVGAVARGVSYSVTVERSGGARRVGGGSAAKAAAFSTVTASSREEDAPAEGWATVNDAQNAAAARALFDIVGAHDAPMPSELPAEFRDAWRRWAEESHAVAVAAEEAAENGGGANGASPASARDAFVAELLASVGKKRDASETTTNEPKDSWDDDDDDDDDDRDGRSSNPRASSSSSSSSSSLDPRTNASFAATSARLREEAASKREDPSWREMFEFRRALPVAALRENLLSALHAGDAAVVCGETGSGKTTQVPQYLLDDAIDRGVGAGCRVVCTQPRRVAALTVAERVSHERRERKGVGGAGSLVGHHVRLDAAVTKDTRLTFMTAGILLRRMHGDPMLSDVSHVVLDEIHERSLDGDFLLALLRDLPAKRRAAGLPPLKLVVMSATLDAQLFSGYLGECAVVSAPGRTHPVTTVYLEDAHEALEYALDEDSRCCRRPMGESRGAGALERMDRRDRAAAADAWGEDDGWRGDENPEYDASLYDDYSDLTRRNLSRLDESIVDYDLIERLLVRADEETPPGAFLVFLPGIGEVSSLVDRLAAHPRFAPRHGKHRLTPLHSALNPAEQREAFRVPPDGVRKIVVATNVAETSVTIEDVVVVVDSGRVKERQWDPRRNMASLEEGWVSRAAARQRAGRAGRVRPGVCYALFTRHRHEKRMRHHQVPELHRVPLTEVVLQIKKLGVGDSAESFLSRALEPPSPVAVAAAVATLREIGAVDASDEGALTPLGHHLAALPVDCRVAKMLVYGAMLSCASPALTVAACLSYKSPFLAGQGKGAAAGDTSRRALSAPGAGGLAAGEQSDHLTHAAAYEGWADAVEAAAAAGDRRRGADAGRRYAAKHGLCADTLRQIAEMRGQYAALLADIGFLEPTRGADLRGGGGGGGGEASASAGRRRGAYSTARGWADDPNAAWNADARRAPVLKAVLAAGLYANVAAFDPGENGGRATWRDVKGEVGIHPSSVNAKLGASGPSPAFPFAVFLEKVKTSRVFVRDATVVAPAALLLFGGVMDVRHAEGRVCLDGWLWLRASAQTAVLFKRLRAALDDALEKRIRGERRRGDAGDGGEELFRVIRAVLTENVPGGA